MGQWKLLLIQQNFCWFNKTFFWVFIYFKLKWDSALSCVLCLVLSWCVVLPISFCPYDWGCEKRLTGPLIWSIFIIELSLKFKTISKISILSMVFPTRLYRKYSFENISNISSLYRQNRQENYQVWKKKISNWLRRLRKKYISFLVKCV